MLREFSDQLASYLTAVLTYASMESPAFNISDPLIHMQGIFTNLVKPMAHIKSSADDFVDYVTDSLMNYGLETVKGMVEGAVRDQVVPKVTAQVSSYGTLGIVAAVGLGIYLATK